MVASGLRAHPTRVVFDGDFDVLDREQQSFLPRTGRTSSSLSPVLGACDSCHRAGHAGRVRISQSLGELELRHRAGAQQFGRHRRALKPVHVRDHRSHRRVFHHRQLCVPAAGAVHSDRCLSNWVLSRRRARPRLHGSLPVSVHMDRNGSLRPFGDYRCRDFVEITLLAVAIWGWAQG